MILYLYWCNIISIHILVIIHENQYIIVKEVMIIWYWLNPHNCVFVYIYLYIHMSNSASTSPFHPILSYLFFLQKDIQWLTYVVKVAIPTRFHDHFVSNSFLFSLTLSFSQPWRFGWRMLAQRESKIRFRYLDKPSKYNQLLWTRRSSRIVWFSPWIVGSMTRGLWYLYVFFFQSVCHKWGLP